MKVLWKVSFWLLVIHVCGSVGFVNKTRLNVFKAENGTFVLVHRGGTVQRFPDTNTISALGFNAANASPISNDLLAMFKSYGEMPTLIPQSSTEDEMMRLKIDKIAALDPAPYWIESHFFEGHTKEVGAYNPTFVKLNERILMSWRTGDINSALQFGWYHIHNHSIVFDPRMEIPNRIEQLGAYSSMEDGRLVAINNNTVAVVYTGQFAKFTQNFRGERSDLQIIVYGVYNKALGMVEFGKHPHTQAQWLRYPEHQKNWVHHNGHVLLYQSINPLHIVRPTRNEDGTNGRANNSNSESNDKPMIGGVKTVVKEDSPRNLPWDGTEYGEHIKGGTPAVMVRGVMLSFFHTSVTFVRHWRTYFMGAITFCPNHPFNIHTMSPVPIVQRFLYDGAWANKFCNYVVFPMGVVLDDDNQHIWLSMGYQDKDGYTVKLHIDTLFESMDIVSDCTAKATGGGQR